MTGLIPIKYMGVEYQVRHDQPVLMSLLDHNVPVRYSCCSGACQSCLLKRADGKPSAKSQKGLSAGLAEANVFLACMCDPEAGMEIVAAEAAAFEGTLVIEGLSHYNDATMILRVKRPPGFVHTAGQFMNFLLANQAVRSYSIASAPLDDYLEFHIGKVSGGSFTSWIFSDAKPGDEIMAFGPFGSCSYAQKFHANPLVLVGTGTGLAPLVSIATHALAKNPERAVHLYFGTLTPRSLYYVDELETLAEEFPALNLVWGVLDNQGYAAYPQLDIAKRVLEDHAKTADSKYFICGAPSFVTSLRKALFLSGISNQNIFSDAFFGSKS